MDESLTLPAAHLLPILPGITVRHVDVTATCLHMTLDSTAPGTPCPGCNQIARRVHSRYQRALADLPVGGLAVRLTLRVRKFFCDMTACPRRIFTERLPILVAPWARKTVRLIAVLRSVAFACGGELGARVLKQLTMAACPATLITLIRRTPLPSAATPRVLGVDDWAKRKGCSYGTILVDLERHQPIELLPERTADPLVEWLETHPGVEIVTRDRSETFAKAITRGAPTAAQVADRWHLLHNWSAVVERVLTHDAKAIRTLMMPIAVSSARPATTLLPAKNIHRTRNYADERRAEVRAHREDLYQRIRTRSGNGEYLTTIARTLGLNYKTVRKYARAAQCPHMKAYPKRTRMLDAYLPYLTARWVEGCHNGKRLHREIVAHGFQGSRVLVAVWAAQRRREEGAGVIQPATAERPLTVRDATWILLSRPAQRPVAMTVLATSLQTLTPGIAVLVGLSDRFTTLLRERQQDTLDSWIADARSSDIKEVRHFAIQLTRDEAAVRAACTVEWSNGQTEGQVNRLKVLKRAMYGRAKFDLLRQRVLYRG